jgi:hypothetical protein
LASNQEIAAAGLEAQEPTAADDSTNDHDGNYGALSFPDKESRVRFYLPFYKDRPMAADSL